jgi:5'-nucleotidase
VTRFGGTVWALGALACAAPPSAVPAAPASAVPAASAQPSASAPPTARPIPVKILGFNDFHGQLSPKTELGRPLGGAAVLAAYLRAAEAGREDHTFIVHAGDFVGASPPNSALLQDEPAVDFLNTLAGPGCATGDAADDDCHVIAALGNHEFDDGTDELLRLLHGGNYRTGPFLDDPWRGARYDIVCANVVERATRKPLVRPYVVRAVEGVPIAFIGAVLHAAPSIISPASIAGLEFLDEADAVNAYVPELARRGVRAIVLVIHQGDTQAPYPGPTRTDAPPPAGALDQVIARLDDEIDVIVSGHTHEFTNAVIPNAHGKPLLVVQARSAGVAYDDIDLLLDAKTHDVLEKSAAIVPTFGDAGAGLAPDPGVARIVAAADARVKNLVERSVGTAKATLSAHPNEAGESALGDLVADAQRHALHADFALLNPGGLRRDIDGGPVTWGELFSVQPFGNALVGVRMTGAELKDFLNAQWGHGQPPGGRILSISGFGYTWDSSVPEGGARVLEIHDSRGRPLDPKKRYLVVLNSFLATGGDAFPAQAAATRGAGPGDLDALAGYLQGLPQPFSAKIEGRIKRK